MPAVGSMQKSPADYAALPVPRTCSRLAAPAGDEAAVRGLGCLLVDRGVQSPGRGTRDISSASRLCRVNSSASPVTPHRARGPADGSHVAELADERRLMGGDLRRPPLSAELAPGAVAGWLRMITITCRPTLPSRAQRHGRLRRPVCRRLPDRRARIVSRVRTKFGRFPTSTRSNSSGRDRR